MRVVKEASERRKEILDVAERLFVTKGYDNASTNDILAEIGIARGTLYYHFSSKEDILDALIDRILESLLANVRAVAEDESIPVLERFTRAVLAGNVDTDAGHMVVEQVHKPQNALMHQKMTERILKGLNPLFVKIVRDGIAQGIFDVEYPEETIEMIIMYANTAFDDLNEYTEEERMRKVRAFIHNVEVMFHMEKGSLWETMIPMFYRQ